MAEMEGFDKINVSFPARRERATVHRIVALNLFKSPIGAKIPIPPKGYGYFCVL